MKESRIADCIGRIDASFIEEAEGYRRAAKRRWVAWTAAACLCLIAAAAVKAGFFKIAGTPPGSLNNEPGAESPVKNAEEQPPEGDGLYIPALDFSGGYPRGDALGVIVYQGKVYVQMTWYHGEEAEAVMDVIGGQIGEAKGNLSMPEDGGSGRTFSEMEVMADFSSNLSGPVYTVKGYDAAFRLSMKFRFADAEGRETDGVCFYENLNGISLSSGRDLFDTRLHLIGNCAFARYMTEADAAVEPTPFRDLSLEAGAIDDFIEALCAGNFVQVEDGFIGDAEEGGGKFSGTLVYLTLHMQDGTSVTLLLFSDGYVGYNGLYGNYYVEMPGEAFDTVFDACV